MNTYTPPEILDIYASRIDRQEKGVMLIKGVYKEKKKAQNYNNYYYDALQSEYDENVKIGIKVPAPIRSQLKNGELYLLKGVLTGKIKNHGSIDLLFKVTGDPHHEQRALSGNEQKKNEVLKTKSSRLYRDVEAEFKAVLYNNKKIRLKIVYGQEGIVNKDVNEAIGTASSQIEITEERINFSSKTEIIRFIKNQKYNQGKNHAIAFVRGGGTGVDMFDDPDIGEALLTLEIPTLSAIGHKNDYTFFDNVADKSFHTPTFLGVFLKNTVEKVAEEKTQSKAVLIKEVEASLKKTYQEKIKALEKTNSDMEGFYKDRIAEFTKQGRARLVYAVIILGVGVTIGRFML